MRRLFAFTALTVATVGTAVAVSTAPAMAAYGDVRSTPDGRQIRSEGLIYCIEPTIFGGDNHLGTGKDWALEWITNSGCPRYKATYELWVEV